MENNKDNKDNKSVLVPININAHFNSLIAQIIITIIMFVISFGIDGRIICYVAGFSLGMTWMIFINMIYAMLIKKRVA